MFINKIVHNNFYLLIAEQKSQEPRPLYYGETRTSPITGKKEIHYPETHRYFKLCCVSAPIVVTCIYIALSIMGAYVHIQDSVNDTYAKQSGIKATIMTTGPSVLYTIVILILNNLYLRTATKLTDWGTFCLYAPNVISFVY